MTVRLTAADWALAIVAACGGLVFAALVLEHTLPDMAPCPLCLMQRLWFLIAGLLAYAGFAHNPRLGIYPVLTIAASLVGAGFAIRQLWLQSLAPDQVPACINFDRLFDFGMWREALQAMISGTGDCAEEPPFLGIPLPAWSLAGFTAVITASVLWWRSLPRSF